SNPIAQWIALISLLYLGMGSLLFLLVMGMVFSRHTLYAPPPSHLMPTLMIGVAPTSVLVILLLRLPIVLEQVWGAPEAVLQVLEWFTSIGAIALWGFSIFWLLLALLLNLVMWVRERPPFALSWWAYIFPMTAFVIASGVLYQVQTHPLFVGLGLAALTLLMLLWLLVFAKTLQGIWTGSLFSPHQPHAPSRPSS
ncbi:MAG: hypothetical protein NZL98_07770, partial [Anaerolineales bacterium]|nr:hypothetical protein [Anaerolineales bacterium]MDW8227298.1 hypothetical protein [Anaerolineales bacterium]